VIVRITWLAGTLRAAGLEVVEHAGWESRAVGGTWSPRFGIVHATAAPAGQDDDVQVRVVRDGRADLDGPIANACVDRRGVWHVLAAGRCNTTKVGTSGPYAGQGNSGALGVEACNDNRSEPWPAVQYDAYVRGWAAICRRLGWSATQLRGHKEHTPGRKSDPTFGMHAFRELVQAILNGEDDDVSAQDVWTADLIPVQGKTETWQAAGTLGATYDAAAAAVSGIARLEAVVAQLAGKDMVDEAAIVAGVLAGLTPEQAAGIPEATAQRVVELLTARLAA
jgi:hypothetical protein